MDQRTIKLTDLVEIGNDMPDLTVRHLAGILMAVPAVALEAGQGTEPAIADRSEAPAAAVEAGRFPIGQIAPVPAAPEAATSPSSRFANPWTPDDDKRLMRLRDDEDRSFASIGKTLGRSERAVEQRFYKLLRARGDDRLAPPDPEPPAAASPKPVIEVELVSPPLDAEAAPANSTGLSGPVPLPPREGPKRKVKDAMSFYAARDREVFSAAADYHLLERLSRGERLPQIASDCAMSESVLGERARELIPPTLRDRRGHMSIEGRVIALEALRRIAHGERP